MTKSHMQACLDEHKYTSCYREFKDSEGDIYLSRIKLYGDYTKSGKYYGAGSSLYQVDIVPEDAFIEALDFSVETIYELRGTSRNALRNELKKLYPKMKVHR